MVIASPHNKQDVGVAFCIISGVMVSPEQVKSIDGLAGHSSCEELCENVENKSASWSSSRHPVIMLYNGRCVFSSYLHLNL